WSEDSEAFVAAALGPAKVESVSIDRSTRTATVMVPRTQLSLAIGRDGQNARLAAKLTGFRIDIKPSDSEPLPDAEEPAWARPHLRRLQAGGQQGRVDPARARAGRFSRYGSHGSCPRSGRLPAPQPGLRRDRPKTPSAGKVSGRRGAVGAGV